MNARLVDYGWYKETYGGTLDEETFQRLSAQGFLFADALTEYRLSKRWAALPQSVRGAVMAAVCAYADQAQVEENGGPVSSETNDGLTRTFSNSQSTASANSQGATAQGRLNAALRVYLAPTGLLYRGRGR